MLKQIKVHSDDAFYDKEVDIQGTTYVFTFSWNERFDSWYIERFAPQGQTPIATGRRVVLDFPMFGKDVDDRKPDGAFVFLRSTDDKSPVGRLELGQTVGFYLFRPEETFVSDPIYAADIDIQ